MKKVLVIASLFVSAGASANFIANGQVVAELLSSSEVQAEIADRSVTKIDVSQETAATTWIYTLDITSVEPGLGPDGASSHPCFTKVVQKVLSGVVPGSRKLKPVVTTVCAMNSRQFKF